MARDNGGTASFRFTTDDLPPHDRAAAVREMHERSTLPVKPEPMDPVPDQPVRVSITQWALPGLGIMSGVLCGLRQHIKPERCAPTVIPHGTAGLELLTKYLNAIGEEGALDTFELQRVATSHVYDLAAVTLGATADGAELARNRGVRAARLQAIKADITAHLDDGNLCVAAVAVRHRVTLRYLQKLFEADGASFSEFVVGQRLANAYRMLTNPLHSHRAIGNIAYDVGFNDLSYFNRAFRRRYGSTPSEVRHGR